MALPFLRSRKTRFAFALLLGALTISLNVAIAVPPLVGREQINGTLWMQRAAEYRIAAEQIYRLATERLSAVAASPGSAALEQIDVPQATLATLPTAIVVDLDETVLDNSFYQARRAIAGAEYDEPSWQAWMSEASAPAIPGAVEYLREASRAGHRIFYVTNRLCQPSPTLPNDPCPAKRWTQKNLQALGLPNADEDSTLIVRGERPEWQSSDKTARRAWIAARYRIVALVGDDLRDFVDRRTYSARESELRTLFGSRWFLLPNPMYGSWERALVDGACAAGMSAADCAAASTARRYAALDPQP